MRLSLALTCVAAALWASPCVGSPGGSTSFSLGSSSIRSFSSPSLFGAEMIVGGTATTILKHPYIVSVEKYFTEFPKWFHNCGGSVINKYNILSAAHCIAEDPKAAYRVRAGATRRGVGGQLVVVSKVFYNTKKYNAQAIDYDVGIFRLKTPLRFSFTVKPIQFPRIGAALPSKIQIQGWGAETAMAFEYPTKLRQAVVSLVNHATCVKEYKGIRAVTERMFCAASPGKDSCTGDSGGPAVQVNTYIQYGIVSWGDGCASSKYPGVYVDLTKRETRNYIDQVLKQK
ncbi:trypsin beta-like [Frankliniella occidentalis]|uniref:trypsin n=1 Tax=Frankliniella occidentalis TaxID=133901 RepID=A0A6J1S324_FRAOC|nr:trypsin beta-like [Frankliniella occidentalis]